MSRNPDGVEDYVRPRPSRLGLEFDTPDASQFSVRN